jgi:CheY-like chemotaxis protein
MNAVIGILELLDGSELDGTQRQFISLAKSNSEALLKVINDILDFSKTEADKLDLDIVDFDLLQFFCDFAAANALTAQQKGLELLLDVSALNYGAVRGDPVRLTQVLSNLLTNAIKFTEHGEIIITARMTDDEGVLLLHCSVADTGVGISEAISSNLFDSFTQADSSTTKKYGGSGLGLAISKQLCELMGGTISVSSQPNSGSIFSFVITLTKSVQKRHELPAINLANSTVLIVDASSSNRTVLRHQLELWGATGYEAASSEAAMAMLDSAQTLFGAVLISRQLPDDDGLSLANVIRSDTRYDNTRLVMMTAVGDRGSTGSAATVADMETIAKPVTPGDLLTVLRSAENTDAVDSKAGSEEADVPTVALDRSHRRRILLVDDNVINREVAVQILEDLGYHPASAENGEQAIAAVLEAPTDDPFHLVLMDCQMPVMDGYEASARIRAADSAVPNKAIPIIAMTANAMEGDRAKCLAAGMNDYLPKPVNIDDLSEKLSYWLEQGVADNPSVGELDNTGAVVLSEPLPVWDRGAALERIGGTEDRLLILLELFAPETAAYITSLQHGVDTGDLAAISRSAHGLKGVASTIGGTRLQALAGALEHSAKWGEERAVVEQLPQLLREYQLLVEALQR